MTLKRNKNSLLVPQEQNKLCDYFYGSYIGFGAGGGVAADLTVGNAVILNDGDSANFSRTNATPTDLNKWTYSTWVKRGVLGVRQTWGLSVFTSSTASAMQFHNYGSGSFDTINVSDEGVSGTSAILRTNAEFRDPHGWYHIVNIYDTDNATEALRFRLFVNGVEITDFATDTIPSSGATSATNTGSATQYLGRQAGSSNYFDGYLAQCVFCDGQAYTPDNFGKFNSKGVWVPKKVSTLTFGDNGFYLDFADSSDLGKDVSGKGNDFTANNFSSTDQTTDTPTSNKATWSNASYGPTTSSPTLENGSLDIPGSGLQDRGLGGSFSVSGSGKYYWEYEITSGSGGTPSQTIGWHSQPFAHSTYSLGGAGGIRAYHSDDGDKVAGSTDTSYGDAWTTNGIRLGVALDLDNGAIYFAQNNTWQDSGDPTSGSSKTGAAFTDLTSGVWAPFVASSGNRGTTAIFNEDNFEYTPPTGFKALAAANLPTPTVPDPTAGFQAITYLGTGANQTITMGGNSYGHRLGSGDRSSLIIATGNGGSYSPSAGSVLVNGNLTDGPGITSYADDMNFKFQFPEAVNITEAMIHFQSAGGNLGTWKWQGSNNDSDWTDVSSNEDLTSCGTVNVITLDSIGASDTYSYYRFIKVSGGVNSNQWEEFSFRVKPTANDRAVSTFQPDLVMIKNRDTTDQWCWFDSVRGAEKLISSNVGTAQATDSDTLTAFTSTGFSLGADVKVNTAGERYVAHCWAAGGGAGSSNTTGSINTRTTSVSTDYGLSIGEFEGDGTAGSTIGHGLGVAPSLVITKNIESAETMYAGHASKGFTHGIYLTSNAAPYDIDIYFNDTAPSSTVVTWKTHAMSNASTKDQIVYCWSKIAGFSDFGSYTGNGNADGPMIYLDFRPALVWIRCISTSGNWFIYDRIRSPFNEVDDQLLLDANTAETTGSEEIDFLSNGFKCRTADAGINTNAATYSYCAWADYATAPVLAI